MFATEAEMVATWLRTDFRNVNGRAQWLVYPETAGWDLLLVHEDGYQVGVQAKLSLNAKVLAQTLIGQHNEWRQTGPDYRAVMVPADKCQQHMGSIAAALGVVIMKVYPEERGLYRHPNLPDEGSNYAAWPNWMPEARCPLPEYVPDVAAGCASPVQLTLWKVKAIKLMILLERRGHVTRADMKALQISPTRLTDHYQGFLGRGENGYVRIARTPDLKVQHPTNWAQIEADFDKWGAAFDVSP
jgi:hypothetical protein